MAASGEEKTPSKLATSWTKILDLHKANLDSDGIFEITATEVKTITGEEPRLTMNIYGRANLPSVLKGITVLPKTDKSYYVINGDGYRDLEDVDGLEFHPPGDLKDVLMIPPDGQYHNEAQAVSAAYIASILRAFTGEEGQFYPAGRGKGGKRDFKFYFDGSKGKRHHLHCNGVRIEIDDGFEGDRIYLIEAKLGSKGSFLIRQLYFPFLFWNLQNLGKEVVPIFFTYSDKVFTLRQYEWENIDEFHSIRLKEAKNYSLEAYHGLPTLADILSSTKQVKALPAGIPFPQADSLETVIDFVDALGLGLSEPAEMAEMFDFAVRQAHYYGAAATTLGLVERDEHKFFLTAEGRKFTEAHKQDRTEILLRKLASLPVFRDALIQLEETGTTNKEVLAGLIMKYDPAVKAESTALRRAQTVQRWIEWVKEQYETVGPTLF